MTTKQMTGSGGGAGKWQVEWADGDQADLK
jgi:hypothetical protein